MRGDIKKEAKKISLILFLIVSMCFCTIVAAKPIVPSYFTKLTLENSPQIGGIAVLKLEVIADFDKSKLEIGCFLPEGLELIKDDENKVIFSESIVSPERGRRIVFYSGSMKEGEKKEFIFRVIVLDGRKYVIGAGAVGEGDYLEIDLGEPEPPEWRPQEKERVRVIEGKQYIRTGIKQMNDKGVSELDIPEDSLPPLRSELRIRTENRPYIKLPYNLQGIPLRYLVYTEEETKEATVTVELPEGLEPINDKNYTVTREDKSTIVNLYRGPMRFKECKAFYFKVHSDKEERFRVKAQTRILTVDGKELIVEDYQDIELGRVLY